jgi:hypothetical protein
MSGICIHIAAKNLFLTKVFLKINCTEIMKFLIHYIYHIPFNILLLNPCKYMHIRLLHKQCIQ